MKRYGHLKILGGNYGYTNSEQVGEVVPIITEANLTSDFTVTQAYSDAAGAGMATVTGLSVTFTATGGPTLLSFVGCAALPEANTTDLFYGYKLDSDTAIVCGTVFGLVGAGEMNISFSLWLTGLTAASHTIIFQASSSQGTDPIIKALFGTSRARKTSLQVAQY